jgi:hypothetical protein
MLPSLAPLSLSLALFPILAATGFTPLYSPPTQCGPFTVNWGGSNITTGPPFILLVLPLDAPPTIIRIPDSAFDPTTNTGKYTLDKFPLKSAAQFVLTMDDSNGLFVSYLIPFRTLIQPSRPPLPTGRATGGVSLIQTVGDSSDATCLTAEVSPLSSFFALNPATPSQCASQNVSWNSTRYREPPDIRGFIPGGQAFTLDRPPSNSTTQQDWDVHVREGTQFLFLVQPAPSSQNASVNTNARTSPLITVTGKGSRGDSCFNTGSPSSTIVSSVAISSVTASISTISGATEAPGNVK